MNTNILAGRENPSTKEPSTDNKGRWWRSEWKLHPPPPKTYLELQLNSKEITQKKTTEQ